ncbi:MAG: DUF4402 domain-containing protein [Bacteroidales bacterium]|nr:DUF4402 domain-containing protein [Bacteroidales bacterium]
MKQLVKALSLAIVMFALSLSAHAQVSETATASATIITPIAIANATDMDFGNIAVIATGGTVVLAPDGSRSVTGDVTLPAVSGTVTAATFDVTGESNFTYSITLPAGTITITNGTDNMTVGTWTSDPTTGAGGTLDAGGAQTLSVGATLNVAGGESSGAYTGGPFTVTVNYN